MKLTVVGCSPAWPNPGGAQSGYLVEDGAGRAAARLRRRRAGEAPRARGLAAPRRDRRSRTSISTTGATSSPGSGARCSGPAGERDRRPSSGFRRAARSSSEHIGTHFGWPDMFERRVHVRRVRGPGKPFATAGFEVTRGRLLHYDLETYGFRVSRNGEDARLLRRLGPCDELVELARDADLFLCEATLLRGRTEGELRGHLSPWTRRWTAFRRGRQRLLITHRPTELRARARAASRPTTASRSRSKSRSRRPRAAAAAIRLRRLRQSRPTGRRRPRAGDARGAAATGAMSQPVPRAALEPKRAPSVGCPTGRPLGGIGAALVDSAGPGGPRRHRPVLRLARVELRELDVEDRGLHFGPGDGQQAAPRTPLLRRSSRPSRQRATSTGNGTTGMSPVAHCRPCHPCRSSGG